VSCQVRTKEMASFEPGYHLSYKLSSCLVQGGGSEGNESKEVTTKKLHNNVVSR
jgi:hypothetical protein